jgi:hypothetical protein
METKDIELPVEDILMLNNPHTEGLWINPDIEKITSNLKPHDCNVGFLDGPFVRIWIGKGKYHAVVMLTPEAYDAYLESCFNKVKNRKLIKNIISMTIVLLTEDVWMPGGEQFCFTEYGRLISEDILDMGNVECMLSPDVGVEVADKIENWSWSS